VATLICMTFAYTYVLKSADGDMYIGSTDDLERRVTGLRPPELRVNSSVTAPTTPSNHRKAIGAISDCINKIANPPTTPSPQLRSVASSADAANVRVPSLPPRGISAMILHVEAILDPGRLGGLSNWYAIGDGQD